METGGVPPGPGLMAHRGSVFKQVSLCLLPHHRPANQTGLPDQHPGGADPGPDGTV